MALQLPSLPNAVATSIIPKLTTCENCSITSPCSDCKAGLYIKLCNAFGARIDPSVVASIITNWEVMQVTVKTPTDVNLVPLSLVLRNLTALKSLQIGTYVSFAHRGDGNWICRSISPALPFLRSLRVLDLQRLGIDGQGLSELSGGICALPSLTELCLRHNYLGYNNGTEALVFIIRNAHSSLRYVDVSCNSLGYFNVRRIEKAAKETRRAPVDLHLVEDEPRVQPKAGDSPKTSHRGHRGCCAYEIDVEGNFVLEEVWNSVLHGIGAILGLIGTFDLTSKTKGQSDKVWWACLVYGLSATCLFTASTLYHSTFLHERARRVFQMLDHSAIFILIAGTYTPIGLIALSNIPEAVMMVTIEWLIALVGITVYLISAHFPKFVNSLPYVIYEVILYIVMGQMCLMSYEKIIVPLDKEIFYTILFGGALYVVGVVFFVLEQAKRIPLMHCIWHVFVLAAAIVHYFAVRQAVVTRLYDSTHSPEAIASHQPIRALHHILAGEL